MSAASPMTVSTPATLSTPMTGAQPPGPRPPPGPPASREPQVLRRIVYAVEVVRDPPLRRRHHDRGAVRELLRLLVPDVAEADRLGERVNRSLVARQEVPA